MSFIRNRSFEPGHSNYSFETPSQLIRNSVATLAQLLPSAVRRGAAACHRMPRRSCEREDAKDIIYVTLYIYTRNLGPQQAGQNSLQNYKTHKHQFLEKLQNTNYGVYIKYKTKNERFVFCILYNFHQSSFCIFCKCCNFCNLGSLGFLYFYILHV